MTLRPQNASQSVRLKRPDGLEGAPRRPLRGIRAHGATSPKRRSRRWSRRPAARGGSRPPPVEEGITSRFFCGRQPCRLIAPLSSEGMPFLTVGFADNRTFCPAVAKTCDYPQAAGDCEAVFSPVSLLNAEESRVMSALRSGLREESPVLSSNGQNRRFFAPAASRPAFAPSML